MDPSTADAIQQLIGVLQRVLPALQEPTASQPAAAAESTAAVPPPPNLEVTTPVGPTFCTLAAARGWDEHALLTTYHQGLESGVRSAAGKP
ncbi:hypothetical protein KOW79_000057 [Hemibagrus wyckioides]|uniref:Uncharacterized protein n=1 Tax=Hemibagrus wyckioides TaxID=337641 RepID=A0A9D3MZI4_9TELE|nr:hypothetical protein KOW79_000057 [Hemibagrus wyckioides]